MSASIPATHPTEHEATWLRTELERQERYMRLLREVALVGRGAVDPREVFAAIYERLREVLPIDSFFVALCDRPDSPVYHFALFIDEGQHIDLGNESVGGLTGWILELKQSRLFRDLHNERGNETPEPQQFGNYSRRSRSWIGVPLMIGRESVGVISLQSYQPAVYNERDLQLVEPLADLAAVAIENAVLYRSQEELSQSLAARVAARSEELGVLTSIASGLSRGQYDEQRLTEALERIIWMLNLRAGVAWLDEPGEGLQRAATYSAAGEDRRLPDRLLEEQPDKIVDEVRRRNQPIFHSLMRDQNGAEESVFAMPLPAHGRVVGVLMLYGEPGRQLTDHERSLLEAAGQQMGIGVENARLYRDARSSAAIAERRADNLALVHTVSRLISSSLDPSEVLRITAEQMVELFQVDHCAIMLFDETRIRGEVVAEFPTLGTMGYRVTFMPGDYLETEPGSGLPGYVSDIATDPRVRTIRDVARQMGARAMLLAPLMSRGRSMGAISLNLMQDTRAFTDEERELCRTVAAQVATALENARLYQLSVTRVEQEMDIARSIQANLFPRALPTIPGARLAGRCVPALETGGDFYDVLPVGYNRFGFSIGDVSGKSLPAAMLMAVARSIVRSEAIDHATPERVVTETNRLVTQDIPPNTFVALCYAVYETASRTLVLANAGQITPFVRHADGTVDALPIVSNLPLGIVADLHYEASGSKLVQGDSVLFLTDGLVEAFAPGGEMFGFDRLADLFGQIGHLPADEVVSGLIDAVCAWQSNLNRHDDMTAIVLQVL